MIITLFVYSILFVSCEAITAQNIKIDPNFDKNRLPGVEEEFDFETDGKPGSDIEFRGSAEKKGQFRGKGEINGGEGEIGDIKENNRNLIEENNGLD